VRSVSQTSAVARRRRFGTPSRLAAAARTDQLTRARYVAACTLRRRSPQSFEAYVQEAGRAARDGAPADVSIFFSEDDAGLARWMLKKTAGDAVADRKLRQLEHVVAHCRAAKGCRRARLLAHFNEAPPAGTATPAAATARPCCDACARPADVAAAAGRLALVELKAAPSAGGGVVEEDEASAMRGGRKRARSDPHDTGLVDSDDDGHAEAVAESNGIARAGGSSSRMVLPTRKGPKLSKAALSARLDRLAAAEEEEEEETDGLARLRARFG
jgi:hypothetical protein